MTDQEFVRAFETCELPPACFHHRDHIRLAWIYVRQYGEAEATRRIEESIRRYAAHLGISEKYHQTITVAWMRLVAAGVGAGDFEEFARRNPGLLEKSALGAYYSEAVLKSEAARVGFVEPDLRAFASETGALRDDVLK